MTGSRTYLTKEFIKESARIRWIDNKISSQEFELICNFIDDITN